MDENTINEIFIKETEALGMLLNLLEEQHELLLRNDIGMLEDIVGRIELCNKDIALAEVERRKICGNSSMKVILDELNDENLNESYRAIKKLINEINVQKDTNEMLIKLGLGYSVKMLSIINPDRTAGTYNSYGKLRK